MVNGQRVVLVTGASSGLGAACAALFLRLGDSVLGLDLSPHTPPLEPEHRARYHHCCADVTDADAVQKSLDACENRFGLLSGAICCAGVLHGERVLGREGVASLDAFRRVIEINVIGTFNVLRLAAQHISRRTVQGPDGERGVIIMTSSIAADDGQIGQAAYAASKGAVASMTLPLAREMARLGIRVVSIAPGVFETPMMQAASDKVRQPLLEQTLFPKRFGNPAEFAALAHHIFENPMLNGTVIRADAGLRM